jgi:hypothetical protein
VGWQRDGEGEGDWARWRVGSASLTGGAARRWLAVSGGYKMAGGADATAWVRRQVLLLRCSTSIRDLGL